MTVNTRVMFRITLYYLPCQAISLPQAYGSAARERFEQYGHSFTHDSHQAIPHNPDQSTNERKPYEKEDTPTLDYDAS
jgi:hypothetical protein